MSYRFLVSIATLLLAASLPIPARVTAPAELPEVVFSRQLLSATGREVGDVVRLAPEPGGAGAREFRIVDRFEPVADPMLLAQARLEARLHLPDLLQLVADPGDPTALDTVGSINLALSDPGRAAEVATALAARVPGLIAVPTRGAEDGSNPFVVLERFHLAIALVTVIGSTAFLFALMVMRADERREMVGILRLIGLSRRRVLTTVFVEGLLVAVVGAGLGVSIARVCENGFNAYFQWHYDTNLVFVRVTAGIAWRCIALAVPLGVLAGLVASWTLLRREILSLLRR